MTRLFRDVVSWTQIVCFSMFEYTTPSLHVGFASSSQGEPGRICCRETFVQVLKDFKQLKPQKKNKSCRVLPSFVMISDISIKPICLALPTTLFLLCCLRGVQFLCVENSAKFAKLRFSFTERELVNCAGSTKMVQSYLLDAPHGAWAGHASICKGISRLC